MAALDDEDARSAALRHSRPRPGWPRRGGRSWALARRAGCSRAVNEPAESALRVNSLVSSVDEVLSLCRGDAGRGGAGVGGAGPAAELPEALVLEGPFDAFGSELFAAGAIMPQSRGSMLVAACSRPSPGERVLDLCAAPGGKTTHLAALMGEDGARWSPSSAIRPRGGAAADLPRGCGPSASRVVDRRTPFSWRADRACDRVLVDPPCSGLGTLQSRPDLRWRASPESVSELAALQARILRRRRGGAGPGWGARVTRSARSPSGRAPPWWGRSSTSTPSSAPRIS